MTDPLRLAGAAALCAALLLTGCAKKTDQTTTSDTTSTQAAADAGATPAADAAASGTSTAAPDTSATATATAATTTVSSGNTTVTTGSGTNGGGSGGYIDLPVYPGAGENKEQDMTTSSNTGSVAMKVYQTKDDAKKVAEWYKAHLPASFKGGILTAGDKTVGTWADEHTDGDQSVIVGSDSSGGTTRIQLTTKHGK